jgi:hypothetical protein
MKDSTLIPASLVTREMTIIGHGYLLAGTGLSAD